VSIPLFFVKRRPLDDAMSTLGTTCAYVSKELTFGIISKSVPHFTTIGSAFGHRRSWGREGLDDAAFALRPVGFATFGLAQMCTVIGADVGHEPTIE
jgi:hypothetical protein